MEIGNEEGVLRADPPLAEDRKGYEKSVRDYVAAGQLLLAIEVARDGLRRFPQSVVLYQQLALALAQTGALDAAKSVLADLLIESPRDEEARSLLGRVYKEIWRRSKDPAAAMAALKTATKWYGEAFDLKWSYYPGINLAFTLLAAGEREKARDVAAKVAKGCRTELEADPETKDGWLYATLGEALTHLGDIEGAARNYRAAARVFRGRWRDLASMQRQAREILRLLKPPAEGGVTAEPTGYAAVRDRMRKLVLRRREPDQAWLDNSFEFPTVAIFAGHMVDAPGRKPARFPPESEPRVREALKKALENIRAGVGYSSAACGADILFCECILERGGRLNLVLPTTVEAFKRQSILFAGGDWEQRFHNVLSNASSCLFANASELMPSNDPATPAAHQYAISIITGLAAMEARALDLDLHALAVWDGAPGDGFGGTSTAVAAWKRRGIEPRIISPATGAISGMPSAEPKELASAPVASGVRQEIRAVVYAEILNYRKVTEAQMPAYIAEFRGEAAKLIAGMPRKPEVAGARFGEQEYLFAEMEDAAHFATAFRDMVARGNWSARGLPADLGAKLVIHAGPVFLYDDPVTNQLSCSGSHVMRTQRIRSITPPGEIYASQEFGALCALEGVTSVRFEFLGRVPTTKLFEDAPLYRVS